MDLWNENLFSKKTLINAFIVIGIGLSSMISTQAAKAVYKDNFNATYFTAFTTTAFNIFVFPIYLIIHIIFGLQPKKKFEILKFLEIKCNFMI